MQKETKAKFKTDEDLKNFCSYVVNRTAYELNKSRAKGYVSGKKFHAKVAAKIKRMKEKRAEKKRQKELKKAQEKSQEGQSVPSLS